jgi:hypothetical protein
MSISTAWESDKEAHDETVAAHVVDYLVLICGALAADDVGFGNLVEVLFRFEFGVVAGQVEQLDCVIMLRDSSFDFDIEVHGVSVHGQGDFSARAVNQSTMKPDHGIGSDSLIEYHDGRFAPIGDRLDYVATDSYAPVADHRRFPAQSVTCAGLMIAAHAYFGPPLDFGVLVLRTVQWILRRQSPLFELAAHGPVRNLHVESLCDQLPDDLPGSPRTRQSHLTRTTVFHCLHYDGRLPVRPVPRIPPPRMRTPTTQTGLGISSTSCSR